jgi:hypothetical protein
LHFQKYILKLVIFVAEKSGAIKLVIFFTLRLKDREGKDRTITFETFDEQEFKKWMKILKAAHHVMKSSQFTERKVLRGPSERQPLLSMPKT